MVSFLKMSESLSLAFHSMVYIACDPERYFHVKDVAENINGSVHHLARIVIQLSKSGLIKTRRGPKGGVRLDRSPTKISLMDIYQSVEGKEIKGGCILGRATCRNKKCIFGDLYDRIWKEVAIYLESTTLDDLSRDCSGD